MIYDALAWFYPSATSIECEKRGRSYVITLYNEDTNGSLTLTKSQAELDYILHRYQFHQNPELLDRRPLTS